MRMKKIIFAVLTVALLCQPLWLMSAKAKTGPSDYSEYAAWVTGIGGADYSKDDDLSEVVSREKFCQLAARFLGLQPGLVVNYEKTPFIDVETNRESYDAVRTMYDFGYVSGDGTRRFYPEQPLTIAAAATIAVNVLGYSSDAMNNGGYPQGYIALAYSKKIFTEQFDDYNKPITLGSVYRMFYDMLDVPIMEVKFDGIGTTYSADENNTVMSSYFKMEKYEGIVTANRYTSLANAKSALSANNIAINDNNYQTDKDYDGFIGRKVTYYISYKDDADGKIVYMSPKGNTETTIQSEDIKEITDNRITYWTSEKRSGTNSVNLKNGISVIYNGQAYTGYGTIDRIPLKNGKITAIDNDNDGKADVLDITEYRDMFVDGINKTDKILYDYALEEEIKLDSDADIVEIFDADGNRCKFADIKKDTLVSLAQSKSESNKLIRVYICSDYVEGTVDALSDEECVISGTSYKLAEGVRIALNSQGIFYTNIEGKVAKYKIQENSDYNYGVIYKVWYDDIEEYTCIKLFSAKEKFETYFVSGKISLNGSTLHGNREKDSETLVNALLAGSVVRYRLNDIGDSISRIEPAYDMVTDKNGNKVPLDSTDFRKIYEGSSFKYRNGMFDGKVIATSDTLMFGIPKSANWSNTDMFGTLTTNSFSGGTSYSKNFRAYAFGENPVNIADVMVVEDLVKGSIGNTTNLVFVTDINEGMDSDDQICVIIKGISGGNTVEYYCVDDSLITDYNIKRGDVLRVGVDSAKRANKIEKIYNADGSSDNGALLVPSEGISENTASFDSEYRVVIGTVVNVQDGYMKFNLKKLIGEKLYDEPALCRTDGASVIRYESSNTRNHIPVAASVNELLNGDTVIMRMNLANAKEIIILR